MCVAQTIAFVLFTWLGFNQNRETFLVDCRISYAYCLGSISQNLYVYLKENYGSHSNPA